MKVLIHIYCDYKVDNLKMFKTGSKAWLCYRSNTKRIIISHRLKLYSKNFDCSRDILKKIISIAKNMKEGKIKWEIILT